VLREFDVKVQQPETLTKSAFYHYYHNDIAYFPFCGIMFFQNANSFAVAHLCV